MAKREEASPKLACGRAEGVFFLGRQQPVPNPEHAHGARVAAPARERAGALCAMYRRPFYSLFAGMMCILVLATPRCLFAAGWLCCTASKSRLPHFAHNTHTHVPEPIMQTAARRSPCSCRAERAPLRSLEAECSFGQHLRQAARAVSGIWAKLSLEALTEMENCVQSAISPLGFLLDRSHHRFT